MDEPVVLGGTYYWLVTTYKDDEVWDITGATVTHYFRTPDNDVKSAVMTILNGPDGTAFHINASDIFDEKGIWEHSYKVELSGIEVESAPEEFTVYKSLSAMA